MRSTRRTSSASRTGSDPAKRFDQLWLTPTKRRGRGQHDALDALAVGIENRAENWILDADIKGFFDNISPAFRCAWHTNETLGSHEWMMKFVERRILWTEQSKRFVGVSQADRNAGMAATPCAGCHDRGAICRRHCCRFRASV
jgi:hypothetical protein